MGPSNLVLTGLGGVGFLIVLAWIAFQMVEASKKSVRADKDATVTRLEEENKRLYQGKKESDKRVRKLESYIRKHDLPIPNGEPASNGAK